MTKTVEANGQRIAVDVAGSGPPLVLIHGAEGDRTMFAELADLLAPRYTVISYDQRDSGLTQNGAEDYGFADLAADAAALITALGHQRASVFGHSLGGVIAQALALHHPEVVDGLILSSTFRLGVSPLPLNPSVFMHIAALRQGLPATAPEIAGYFFPAEFLQDHPGLSAMFEGTRRTPEQAGRRARIPPDGPADLGTIRTPTLVLAGSEDRLIPPDHTRGLADEIVGAMFEWVQGAGHIGPMQKPATVAAAVARFLDTLDRHPMRATDRP